MVSSNQALIEAFHKEGITDAQLAAIAAAVAPGIRAQDSLLDELTSFADRAAGNGFVPELAADWGQRLLTAAQAHFAGDLPGWLTELVDHLNNGAGVAAVDAAKLARSVQATIADLSKPTGLVIDTTATEVAPPTLAPVQGQGWPVPTSG